MKITSIPHAIRSSPRGIEVLSVLAKYGLAGWVNRLDVNFAKDLLKGPSGELLARHSRETRVRLALSELGPTFIKLGQIFSTRPDLVGLDLAVELQKLQDDAPADSPKTVRETIEAELGQPADELFAEFEDRSLASASIGQVHGARLQSGERVVVKVQHKGIERKVRIDLDILAALAQMAELVPEFKNYRPRETFAEFQRTLLRELDFGREERHMQEFAHLFADDPHVHIPRPFPDLSTGRVLTMERLDGIKLVHRDRLLAAGFDLQEIARRGADMYLEMIFIHGFYHADPHPGNLLVLNDGVIGLLDFGMIGRIDEPLREQIEEMLLALIEGDATHLTSVITRVGRVPAELDRAALSIDVADFVSNYTHQPLGQLDLTGALRELTEMIRRYQIILPARIAMLIKVLVMLEGTARLLSPTFNLVSVMQPYQRKLIWRRFSPTRQWRRFRRIYSELEQLVEVLPRSILEILEQVQSGRFDVHLDHRGLEPSVNRLVLGMLASALFLGSSLLLSLKVVPLIKGVSIPGVVGITVSLLLVARLLRAINKSGKLDRRDRKR